jgi:dihydrolipoamide dehydrogenase
VGLNEDAAKAAGRPVRVSRLPFRALGVSYVLGAEEGLVKVVSDPGDGTVLGVQICGPGAPELIAEAAVIVARKLTINDVRAISHAHPTQAEIIYEAIAAAGNLHTSG